MKFKTAEKGKNWIDLKAPAGVPPLDPSIAKDAKAAITQILSATLLSEHLTVLTGLGTSLCLQSGTGNRLAPTMIDLWDQAHATIPDFEPTLVRVNHEKDSTGSWVKDMEALLSRCQMAIQLNNDALTQDFILKAEALIASLCNFLPSLPVDAGLPLHEAFLRKLARRPLRLGRTKLFTTNYDLCFETAASRIGFTVIDGFSHTSPQYFDGSNFSYDLVRREGDKDVPAYISNVFHLCKLHGSIDWQRTAAGDVQRTAPTSTPLIIYPRAGKFESSYQQPYLEMMSRFQSALRQPNSGVLVVGFGFNDLHLVEPLRAAIRSNPGLNLIVVGLDYDTAPNPTVSYLSTLIDAGDRRITLVSGTFEDLVELIPDLVADTDEEKHNKRFKVI